MEGGGEGVEMVVDSKDLQQQSKAFDKLTDRVEDRQLNSTRVQEAMASIAASSEADRNAMRLSRETFGNNLIQALDSIGKLRRDFIVFVIGSKSEGSLFS
ncbi:unnamed protein product [Malus baccata var. baccata]